jgi:hypothetical protein
MSSGKAVVRSVKNTPLSLRRVQYGVGPKEQSWGARYQQRVKWAEAVGYKKEAWEWLLSEDRRRNQEGSTQESREAIITGCCGLPRMGSSPVCALTLFGPHSNKNL